MDMVKPRDVNPLMAVHGKCTSPNEIQKFDTTGPDPGPYRLRVPCNNCKNCMAKRWQEWINRMGAEMHATDHTVFFTGTFADSLLRTVDQEAQRLAPIEAARKAKSIERHNQEKLRQAHKKIEEYKATYSRPLDPEVIANILRTGQKEITGVYIEKIRSKLLHDEVKKFFKRLRKNTGAEFRYIAIMEIANGKSHLGQKTNRYKSGNPHFHMLIHFTGKKPDNLTIRETWNYSGKGTKSFRTIGKNAYTRNIDTMDDHHCRYIAKYLGKGTTKQNYGKYAAMRINPSKHYGENWEVHRANYFQEPHPLKELFLAHSKYSPRNQPTKTNKPTN